MNEARDDARDKPATATVEEDLSENEDDSNFWDYSSSTEDDVFRATASNDGDSKEGDDDSSAEQRGVKGGIDPGPLAIGAHK